MNLSHFRGEGSFLVIILDNKNRNNNNNERQIIYF